MGHTNLKIPVCAQLWLVVKELDEDVHFLVGGARPV